MAQVAISPHYLRNIGVQIGTDNFERAVNSVRFTPTAGTATWKGGTPADVYTGVGASTWTATLNIGQDLKTTTSLVNYLMANEGKTVQLVYVMDTTATAGSKPTVTAQVILSCPELGGDMETWLESSLTFGVVGKPAVSLT